MIVNGLETAKKYLPSLNTSLLNDNRLEDFFRREQEWTTRSILGEDIEQSLESVTDEDLTHGPFRIMVGRLISELGFRMAVAEMDLQLSEAGFVVQNNQQFSPASQQRVDRLVASLEERIAWDCDAIVKYLIKHSAPHGTYENWRGSEAFAYLTQAFTPTLEEAVRAGFKAVPGTDKIPWTDFLDRLPEMAQAIRNVASPYVSEAEIDRLLKLYRGEDLLSVHRRAIEHLRKAGILELFGLSDAAVREAIMARKIMLNNQRMFTAFAASDVVTLAKTSFGNGPSFNCL